MAKRSKTVTTKPTSPKLVKDDDKSTLELVVETTTGEVLYDRPRTPITHMWLTRDSSPHLFMKVLEEQRSQQEVALTWRSTDGDFVKCEGAWRGTPIELFLARVDLRLYIQNFDDVARRQYLWVAGYRTRQPLDLMCQSGDNAPSTMVLEVLHQNETVLATINVHFKIIGGEEKDVLLPPQWLGPIGEVLVREANEVRVTVPTHHHTYTYHGPRR